MTDVDMRKQELFEDAYYKVVLAMLHQPKPGWGQVQLRGKLRKQLQIEADRSEQLYEQAKQAAAGGLNGVASALNDVPSLAGQHSMTQSFNHAAPARFASGDMPRSDMAATVPTAIAAGTARDRPSSASRKKTKTSAINTPTVDGALDVDPNAIVGRCCERYWPNEGGWYKGVVYEYLPATKKHKIVYDLGTPRATSEEYSIIGAPPSEFKLLQERVELTRGTKKKSIGGGKGKRTSSGAGSL